MKLYELTNEFNQALIDLDGMDQQIITDTLEELSGDIREKSKNVAAYFLNLDADTLAMKEAEQKIAKRRKALESQSRALKDYLRSNMEASGVTKIECPEFKVTLRKPIKVVKTDNLLDKRYIVETISSAPDKKAIKADLLAGVKINGAELVDGKAGLIIK